ncbi:hypothetical protein sos41_11950 [Alphaproteobacteria bacterium SO-S41]|nr:hypothetical protein sos41_11950 [Alphaproteobacteria bacterium SO-S41]
MNALLPRDVAHAHAVISRTPFKSPAQTLVPEGEMLAETVARAVVDGALTLAEARSQHLEITVNGQVIPRALWRLVRPKAGMVVLVRIRAGNSGGSGKKNPLRTILTLLVVVAVAAISGGILGPEGAMLAGSYFAAGSTSALIAAGVASIALNALVNFIAPVPQPQLAERSQSYTLAGTRNSMDPYGPCIVTLGQKRVIAKLASRPFTRISGDQTVLYMLFQWHVGKCELSQLKIGDTLLSDFQDVTVQHRLLSEPYLDKIALIPNLVIENPEIQIELKQADGAHIRAFPKQAFRVSLDLSAPGGLFESKDGSNKAKSVSFGLQYRAVGDVAWTPVPMAASPHMAGAGTFTLNLNHPDAIRRTIEWEPAAGVGDYEVQVWRITADTSSTAVSDEFYWLGVRGDRHGKPVLDDSLCVTAVRIVASGQLNGVIDQLNAVIEPIIPIYSGGNWNTEAKSRNPAAQFRWLHMGQAVSPADAVAWSGFDQEAINYWYGYCVTKSLTCDHVIDYAASIEEAAQLVASCGYASSAWALGKRTAIIDDSKVPTQLFTSQTVRNFRGKITYPEDVHALRCNFSNAAAGGKPDEIIVYADGYDINTATKFQQVEVPGKTLAADVWKVGRRLLARARIRRIGYEFEIDTECLISRFGDRVLVEHFALHREAMSANVEDLIVVGGSVVGVTLSEDVTMVHGTAYGLQLRRGEDGVLPLFDVVNPAAIGVPVTTRTLTFDGAVLEAFEPEVGDLCVWGRKTLMTLDASIAYLDPANDEFSASVIAVPYDASLFSDDGAVAPAHQTFINAAQDQGLVLNPVAPLSSLQRQLQAAILGVTAAVGDGVLTPSEKVGLVPQLKQLINTQAALDGRATALGITTEKTAFDSAMSTLIAYLATLTTPVAWDSQSDNTTVDGPTLISDYRGALEKQVALQDAIDREAAKQTVYPINDTNRVRYSRMEKGTFGWGVIYNASGLSYTVEAGTYAGYRFFKVSFTATAPGQILSIGTVLAEQPINVTATERLSTQAKFETQGPCDYAEYKTWFYDQANTFLSGALAQIKPGVSTFPSLIAGFVDVPASARSAYAELYYHTTGAGVCVLTISEPMVSGASASQTQHPAFTFGAGIEPDTADRLVNVEAAVDGIAVSAIKISNGIYGGTVTLGGASWITLNSAAVIGIPAGYVVTFDSAAIDSGAGINHMSSAGTILGEWDIAHQPTSGGTVVSLFSGTFKATMPATGEPTDLELTGAGNPAAVALTYTGDVTFLLRMKRLSGPTTNSDLKGAFRGTATA